MMKVFIETLRTPRRGGTAYWDRRDFTEPFVYKPLPGDYTNRLKNIVRPLSDTSRLIIMLDNTPARAVERQISIDEAILSKSLTDAAQSLCSVINAVVELKNTNIISAKVKSNKFVVTYMKNGEQHQVVQPLE